MPQIEITGLTRSFGGLRAVDGLSITVEPGEIYGFLGPNGAGKTTTLRIIAGLMRPDSGVVRLDGHDVLTDPMPAKKILGYVPDRPHVYDKLTAREFMAFVGGLYEMEAGRVAEGTDRYLDLFGLGEWKDELVEGFSHGMKQRLVMSAALLHEPKVLIVDEPMVGLDPRGARLLRDVFVGLKAGGASVLMSTHSLDVAEKIADRVGIINRGRLIAEGNMEEMRTRADMPGSALEEVFLKLTEESAE